MIFAGIEEIGLHKVFKNARRQIVLYAPPYGNFANNEFVSGSLNSALAKESGPSLMIFCLPDIDIYPWVGEFMKVLRPKASNDSIRQDLDHSRIFLQELKLKFKERISIYEMPIRPCLPFLIIDDRILFGHFAYSQVMTPEGFWCSVEVPVEKLFTCAESGRIPTNGTHAELAAFRIISEYAFALEKGCKADFHAPE
ncbi:hypothetical protein [Maridesulfovibrio zosterae]|uniref:hypothetical protein n=1 Tax=Maridesulfovibrio zosterae TaxID=82171 RepID=UPI0004138A45|nr:hypothetical protein [Maridesulfovibrio zosterae]